MLARAVLYGLAVLVPAPLLASHLGTIVPIDFGGDGDTDYAIFRASEGRWMVKVNPDQDVFAWNVVYGRNGDLPVPMDYDGDGRTDFAVFRPSYGGWFLDTNRNGGTDIQTIFGTSGGVPAQGVYELASAPWDLGFYRPSEGRLYVDTTYEGEPNIQTAIGGRLGDVPLRMNGWIHDALGVR